MALAGDICQAVDSLWEHKPKFHPYTKAALPLALLILVLHTNEVWGKRRRRQKMFNLKNVLKKTSHPTLEKCVG